MENLLDDALLCIFSYLTHVDLGTAMCVCQRWRRLASEMRARDPCRTAVQLCVYVPPSVRALQWKIDELRATIRRDVRTMMTRPAFGFFVMSGSFSSHVMSLHVDGVDQQFDKFHKWCHEYYKGNYYFTAYCMHLMCAELVRHNTNKSYQKCRLTSSECLFVEPCGVSTPDGREYCDRKHQREPALGVLWLPAHMPQAYRVCTKQMYDSTYLPKLQTCSDLAAWLGLDANERLRFLLVLVDDMKFGVADGHDGYQKRFFQSLDKVRFEAHDHPNDVRNFAVAVGAVKRTIRVLNDNVTDMNQMFTYTVMALIERQAGCVRVAQVRVNDRDNARDKLKELEKTGIVRDIARATSKSYFLIKLTDYFSQCTTVGDKELLERTLDVKSMPVIGLYTGSMIAHDYLPDYIDSGTTVKKSAPVAVSERDPKLMFYDELNAPNKVFTIIRINKNC